MQNKTFAKHLQKCLMCFILHVTTSRNVLQMFYAKKVAKMLQNICKNIFANVLAC